MLSKTELKNIGKVAIAEMFGTDFLDKYGHDVCLCMDAVVSKEPFGMVATKDIHPLENFKIGDETKSEYAAFITIDTDTGSVHKDYEHSRLPARNIMHD